MGDFEELTKKQIALEQEIQRLWVNYKKDSATRKNQEYLQKRLEALDSFWTDFQINNGHLYEFQREFPKHDYFMKNFFMQVEKKYEEIKTTFRSDIKQILQGTDTKQVQDGLSADKSEVEKLQKADETQKLRNAIDVGKVAQKPQKADKAKMQSSDNDQQIKIRRMSILKENFVKVLNSIDVSKSAMFRKFKADQLKDCWNKITELNDDILTAFEDQELEEKYMQDNELSVLEEMYQESYISLQESLSFSGVAESGNVAERKIKLPTLSIPVFSGKYEEWTSFWELYVRLIHENKELSEIEKMHYLKSNLRGEASKIIGHLMTSAGNYSAAIEIIKKRFHNPAALVNNYIQKLLGQRSIRAENSFDLKTLMDSTKEILYGIENLGVDVKSWDPLVINLLLPKLDSETRKLYQQSKGSSTEIPKLCDLFDFIEARFRSLENNKENSRDINRDHRNDRNYNKTQVTTLVKAICIACGDNHQLYLCKKFAGMKVQDRRDKVKQAQLCFNCFRSGHDSKQCNNKRRCTSCNLKHNSLLHIDRVEVAKTDKNYKLNAAAKPFNVTEVAATTRDREQTILLATAMVNINVKAQIKPVRALIDQGSQSCVVTEQLAKRLKIPLMKYETQVNGINGQKTQVVARCTFMVQSIHDETQTCQIEAIVMPRITSMLPPKEIEHKQWPHIKGLQLADPWFSESKEIDLLLGSDVFPVIIGYGLLKGPGGTPMAQNTIFGWILSGPVITSSFAEEHRNLVNEVTSCVSVSSDDDILRKFWELEEVPSANLTTSEERECENHYKSTHSRDETGRYIVKLPLHEDRSSLGDSRKMALKRFYSLENRFARNPTLREEYVKFIQEYISLGHMQEACITNTTVYYVPHHAIIKEDSTTTKLRVVFDASAKTTSGKSLNNIMMTGPKLQKDLLLLLLQWRTFPVVFTADIEKMYRQILIHQDDKDLQRIFWRESTNDPIKEYTLNTVTYGTASAPYLAIKTLTQLAEDEKINYPNAYETLSKQFYVDDCLAGANSVEEGENLQQELIQLLQNGGFKLRKWTSNRIELLHHLPKEDVEIQSDIDFKESSTIKILGIKWCSKTDEFNFKVNTKSFSSKNTKRSILSDAGKLFDPFGWLSPIIIKAKIMIQKLWLRRVDWDQEVPTDLQAEWHEFKSRLPAIDQLKIPRWIKYSKRSKIELHGFADASQAAYAAVVYARVIDGESVTISLIVSKTKVAPVKQVQLARLELCAMTILTRLINYIKDGSDIEYDKLVLWSDSKIVLGWLKQHPVKWTTFVANRVSFIQENFRGQIRFIPGKENPADIPSRGAFGDNLLNNSLWWCGPQWLTCDESKWPMDEITISELPESRKIITCAVVHVKEVEELTAKFSSLNKLYRVTAYCMRFAYNVKHNNSARIIGPLKVDELKAAEKVLVRCAQSCFEEDMKDLMHKRLKKSSSLYSMNPFIDADGILRVGGRMRHSNLPTDQKHPMILSNACLLTKLIINQAHLYTMHGGVKLTLNYTRNKFWIIRGTQTVKALNNKCLKCFRFKAQGQTQLMGQLPHPRVSFSRPFTHCGVDYAGPLHIRCSQVRGVKSHKCYIAIFVCLSTKAIHIELTSDLTTEGFFAALQRMISRRGAVHHIYSDNGTNFVGGNNLLKQIQEKNSISEKGVQWHFIPPGSPHFGGLWESAVKSVKYHLNRTVGEHKLTYEEMNTILVQIEGILNSRPICALSNNTEDLDVLTPGHFLIGSAILTPTNDSVINIADSSLKRWKLVQKIKQNICNRWYQDYIKSLQQQRYKWTKQKDNLEPGQIVLLKDEALFPTRWPLGRVVEVFKGSDGLGRVATVKTQKGSVKRSIQKICLLPNDDNINNSQDEEEQSVTTKNQFNKKRPGKNLKDKSNEVSTLSVIMLLCLLANPREVTAKHTITHPSAGLFVEGIGTAKVQRGTLRCKSSLPISTFTTDQISLNKTMSKMSNLCNSAKELTHDSQCNELVHHLQEEWKNIFDIFNRFNIIPRRQKRGILGTVMTSLFGVNDEVYHDIESIDKNQKELIKNAKTNTKIMLSTMVAVNETEARINAKINNFTRKLNEGIQAINSMDKWYKSTDANKVNIHILNAYLVAISYMKEVELKYNKLLNAYLKRSHLYEFISHQQATEIIANCTKMLGTGLEVLAEPLDKLDVIVTSTEFIIAGYFPITDVENYELLKINAIPEKIKDNVFQEVQMTTSLFGVNFNLHRYFESSNEDINKAIKWNSTTLILQPAIFLNIDTSEHCIIQQLYKKLSFKRCPSRNFGLSNIIWKELWTHNAWIFVTPIQTTVDITCGATREEVVLNETGIIHITPDCIIQSKFIRLEAHLKEEISAVMHYSKPLAMISSNNISSQKPIQILNETVIPLTADLNELLKSNEKELSESLSNLHATNWKSIRKHQHWMSIIVATIGAIVLLGIVTIFLRIRGCRNHFKTSNNIELQNVKGNDNSAFEVKW